MKSTMTDLWEARKLIEDPSHWTTRAYARDKNGEKVPSYSDSAERFCAVGACQRVGFGYAPRIHDMFFALGGVLLSRGYTNTDVVDFNDRVSHEEVLKLFDEAIAQEKKVEPASG